MLLTSTERIHLERIRAGDNVPAEGLAEAIKRGWAERGGKTGPKLTEAGLEALSSDENDRRAAREAQRPRRR